MTTKINVRPDGVGVLTLCNPPVNSLASSLMESMDANFQKLATDPAVKAIVITGRKVDRPLQPAPRSSGSKKSPKTTTQHSKAHQKPVKMTTKINVRPDGVGVLTLCNPPVNSLATTLMESLEANFQKLVSDPAVKAIVVTGEGNFFCGGAEISEFGKLTAKGPDAYGPDESPVGSLTAIFDKVDAPTVAPLEVFLPMLLTGAPVNAAKANKAGIIDAVVKSNVVDEAARFALKMPPNPVSKRPVLAATRFKALGGALEMTLNQASQKAKGMIAPAAIIKCVEAACSNISFEEGVKEEGRQFKKLLFSVQSAALRHLFFSERLANKVPGLKEKPAPIKKVGIVGAGLMGTGIAICFIQKGVPVILKDAKQEWLDNGVKNINKIWNGQASKGRLPADKLKQYQSLLKPTLSYDDFKDCDIIVEAVPEIMSLKKEIFQALDKSTKPDALICTNTSGLNIDEIAAELKDPSRCMGTHFFSPANVMQLLENVRTAKASDKTVATCMEMGKMIKKKAVLVGNCDGFVGNRMLAPYASEAKQLIEDGATIEQVDRAAQDFGMAMGPMTLGDLVGQELFWKQRKAAGDMNKQTKTYMGPYELTDWLCEQGRFGLKTPDPKIGANGRGIYIHRGRDKMVDPEVVAKLEEIRKTKNHPARKVTDEEICERLFFSMINEGFKILEEGFAQRSSDIDIVYIFGYGFPPSKGGPMFYAENYVGLAKVLERVQVYNKEAKERFTKNKAYLPVDYFEPSKLLIACAQAEKAGMKAKVPPGVPLIDAVIAAQKKGNSKL
eukprot:CAMPEP_0206462936 /NCGR_PEP_ID=MMETSP0324_2-20121206/26282_1 /ASSEMBLY_ACC=CAM_ASM_000836 /TAXON_ID=2866 /ORGANISM="Crypthecodinium cohnii, Strain Seligo" /LENGTH=783 /DNA_ID=CAMNT_0053935201 /DNA_START=48 /DNA_END=2400 /DNA_ORIENTATION=-